VVNCVKIYISLSDSDLIDSKIKDDSSNNQQKCWLRKLTKSSLV